MPINIYKILFSIAIIFSLLGCKTDLYTGLSQKEGNEMLSILLNADIDTDKVIDSEGFITLLVDESELSYALDALKDQGYPKEKFATLDKIFPDEGLISSPVAERARLMYVKSQEISSTLSEIDGVITARVHIVKPEEKAKKSRNKKEQNVESSASVFIKHIADIDIGSLVPQIKLLVNNSIENLAYEKISVILVPAIDIVNRNKNINIENVLFIDIDKNSKIKFIMLICFMIFVLILSNVITFFVVKHNENR